MKNFALGPVEMFPYTLEVASQQVPYFRTPEFSSLMLETDAMFKECLQAPSGTQSIYLTASGTAAMEAVVFNCFNEKDTVLIIDGGLFAHRFVEICAKHGIEHDVVKLNYGEQLRENVLTPFSDKNYTAVITNAHETSTGQLYDLEMISRFCKNHDSLLIVDAISSFMADEYNMHELCIDATILSSQKGLALGPGMSFVFLSERLYTNHVLNIDPPSLYFDFKEYVKNFERGQTPFTPAVRVAYELHDMLSHVLNQGINIRVANTEALAKDFRARIAGIDTISIPEYPLSNASTPLLFSDGNGDDIYQILRNDYGIGLTPCGGDLFGKMIRVGHIGNHTVEENELLDKSLREALAKWKSA